MSAARNPNAVAKEIYKAELALWMRDQQKQPEPPRPALLGFREWNEIRTEVMTEFNRVKAYANHRNPDANNQRPQTARDQ